MATFILAGSMLLLLAMFDSGLRNLQASSHMSKALLAAESRLARIRAWCLAPAHFHQPSTYPGLGSFAPVASAPGLQERVLLQSQALYSPDWNSEGLHLPGSRRQLTGTTLSAAVDVRWGLSASQQVRLVSQLAEPNCGWHPTSPIRITMNPAGASLAQGEVRNFSVAAFDRDDRPLPGLTFAWTVVACTSDGSLQNVARDGRQAQFIHQLNKPGGGIGHGPPGEVWVQVTARFWGVERSAREVLNLL